MAMTKYLVFERDGGWQELFEIEARSAKKAMELAADARAKETGDPVRSTYAAVAVGNWTVAPVGVEIQTRITVG